MKQSIIIPARFGSTRLPGKPLIPIAGKPLLARVVEIAKLATLEMPEVSVVVATDDERITSLCKDLEVPWVMTSPDCTNGTERVYDALERLQSDAEFVLNFQGDAPLVPPWFLTQMLEAAAKDNSIEVITPVVQLTWNALDDLREHKKTSPFSGCLCVRGEDGKALWFSKNVIPAIRKEKELRQHTDLSPAFRHLGVYGYRRDTLARYITLPQSSYEKLEGLEQLRFLENGISVTTIGVDYKGRPSMSGVDSPADVVKAEALIKEFGEFSA